MPLLESVNTCLPPHVPWYIAQVAMKMHSSFSKQEVSTESPDIVGSQWTCVPSESCCAFYGVYSVEFCRRRIGDTYSLFFFTEV
jgi:hypothetical protein